MRRHEVAVLAIVVSSLLCSGGCVSLARSNRQETTATARTISLVPLRDSENLEIIYSYVAIEVESYFDIINRQAKERARALRYHSKWKTTRHIGFFGTFNEYEKQIGAKVVFPW